MRADADRLEGSAHRPPAGSGDTAQMRTIEVAVLLSGNREGKWSCYVIHEYGTVPPLVPDPDFQPLLSPLAGP